MLGAQLIERGARQIRLTGLGEALVMRARDYACVRSMNSAISPAPSYNPLTGRLRIGVIPTIAPLVSCPRSSPGSACAFPASICARARRSRTSWWKIWSRVGSTPRSSPCRSPNRSLHEEPLFAEEFVLVRREAEAGKPVPNVESLREMRLLLPGGGALLSRSGALPSAQGRAPCRAI